jgi:Cytochrome C oxidase, cbb3-type, subunit III
MGQIEIYRKIIEQCRQLPNSKDAVDLSQALYQIQRGQLNGDPGELVKTLTQAGATLTDAYSAVVQGLFVLDKMVDARQLLDAWIVQEPNHPQPIYFSAIALNIAGKSTEAEAKFLQTVAKFPRHELSWLALVDLYSRPPQVRFQQANAVLTRFVQLFPDNSEGPVRLSRIQRRLGNSDSIDIGRLQALDQPLELAKSASSRGDHAVAVQQLAALGLRSPSDFHNLTDRAFQLSLRNESDAALELNQRVSWSATEIALQGRNLEADQIFEVADDRAARLRRVQDIDAQQAVEATQALTDERNAMSSPAFAPNYPTIQQVNAPEKEGLPVGMELYRSQCSNCHGLAGDAAGRAASNLFPPARSFRHEPIRMISAENRLATDADLRKTVRNGLPGSSMPAFSRLTDAEVDQLVEVIRWFQREGLVEQYAELFGESGHGVEHKRSWIDARIVAGSSLSVEPLTQPTSVDNGRQIFSRLGCNNCHSIGGSSDQLSPLHFDSLGRALRAPNLAVDALKGGSSAEAISARIVLGIPGTPHPATSDLSRDDLQSLVAFIISGRSVTTSDTSTNFQRHRRLGKLALPDK